VSALHEAVECSHELCNCTVMGPAMGGDAYCSNYCRSVDDGGIESDTCPCGHPECDTP
jgi:hypothetical protein